MARFDTPEELTNTINSVLGEKINEAKEIAQELKEKSQLISVELPKKITAAEVTLPDEFLDSITGMPMENPVQDPWGYTLDQTTWDQLTTHPQTRAKMDTVTLKPNVELKTRIDEFKKKNPEVWQKATG
jgi:U-box domain